MQAVSNHAIRKRFVRLWKGIRKWCCDVYDSVFY